MPSSFDKYVQRRTTEEAQKAHVQRPAVRRASTVVAKPQDWKQIRMESDVNALEKADALFITFACKHPIERTAYSFVSNLLAQTEV